MNIAYLAVPYTHSDPAIMQARYSAVTHAAAWLLTHREQYVFSPITHTHPIKMLAGLSDLWEQWAEYDTFVIEQLCSGIIVLQLEGWDRSVGVTAERELALSLRKPVELLLPETCGLISVYPYVSKDRRRASAPYIS